ncbi:TetR/AcrR family transcriptional regulator [Phytomonospora endophytica]|uniref:AcrR family transcriptional regulator n=1 Tax=Phytomonospora endophytica TaxID=714109 RepID=A0A841FFI2_9ACTN|nr:TetR/AcrR family transcriptional regulator [Phytomonospora endophytica]MBB6034604.1 AcrR family transcriptional regulator [Phytomonospora endophytica]GIG71336.1 TetR family transcriptional regulator [Phytomonospora endophytica]
MTAVARPGPRDRLLAAARDLTYRHGVSVGVDAILKEAEVARRSLYQHFGGKDELVAEVLRTSAAVDERRYADGLDSGGDEPRARLLALFDRLGEFTGREGFHGCRYIAAHSSLTSPEHPAYAEIIGHKDRVLAMLRAELDAMGHPGPEGAAIRLQFLVDAILVEEAVRPGLGAAAIARPLVEAVLDAQ